MSNQESETPETGESTEAKPTITIAEKQSDASSSDAKPTITIAEKTDNP